MFNTEAFKNSIAFHSCEYWAEYNYLVSHPKYPKEKLFTYEEEWFDDDQEDEDTLFRKCFGKFFEKEKLLGSWL